MDDRTDDSGLVEENMDPRLVASSLEVKLEPVPEGLLSSQIYPGIQPYSGSQPYPVGLDFTGSIPYIPPPPLTDGVKDEGLESGAQGSNGDYGAKLEPGESEEKGAGSKKFKHKIGEFNCPDCEYSAKRNDKLKLHIQTKHEGLRFPCEYCEYAALRPDKLRDHRRKKHGIETTYPCDVCEFVGENYRSLQIHLKEHPAKTGIYGCDSCNFTTNRPFKLQEHIEKKHQMRVLNCTECDFVAETGQSLIEHKEVIHKIKQYPCDDCDYVAKRPDHLKNHQRRIHGKVVTTTWRRGGGGKPIDDEDLEDMEEIDPSFWLFHQVSPTNTASVLSPQGSEEPMVTCEVSYELKDEFSNNESDESSRVEWKRCISPRPYRIVEDEIDSFTSRIQEDVLENGKELRSRFFLEIQAELNQTTVWNDKISALKSLLAGVGQINSEDKINFSDTVPVEKIEIRNHDQVDQVGQAQFQGSHHDLNAQPKPDFYCPGIGLGPREHVSLDARVLADLDQEGILLGESLDIGFYTEISTVVPDTVQILTPSSPVLQGKNGPASTLSSPVLREENETAPTLSLQALREENEPTPMEFSPRADQVTSRSPEPGFFYWNSEDEISPVVTSVLQESIGEFVSLLDRNSFDLSHVEELSQENQMSFSTVENLDTSRMKDHLIEVLKSLGVSDAEFKQNLETRIVPCAGFQQNLETDLAPSTELQYPNNNLDSHLEFLKYPDADLALSPKVLKIPKTKEFLQNPEYVLAPCLESMVASHAEPRQNLETKQSLQNPDTGLIPRPEFQEIVETEFAPCPEFQQNPTEGLAPSLEFQKILKTKVSSRPEFPQSPKPNDASHPESRQKPEIKLASCPLLQKTPETKLAACPEFKETSETKVAPCPKSEHNPETRLSLLELQEIPEIKFSLHIESQQNLITELASSPELHKTPELHQTPVIEFDPSPEIQLVLNTKLGSQTDAVSDTKVKEINASLDAENNLTGKKTSSQDAENNDPEKQLFKELEPKPATSLILDTEDTLSNYSKTELFSHTETKLILDKGDGASNNTIPKTFPNKETSLNMDAEDASKTKCFPNTEIIGRSDLEPVLKTEDLPDLQEKDKSSLHRILSLYRTRMRRDSVNYQNVFNLTENSDENDESEKTSSDSESDSSSSDSDLPTGNEITEMNLAKVGIKPELPVSKSRSNDFRVARKSRDSKKEFKERLEVSDCSIEKKRKCDHSTNFTSKGGEKVREVYKYAFMFPGTPIPVIEPNPFSSVPGYIIPTILSTSTGYPCISEPATSTGYSCIPRYPCVSKPATPTGYSCITKPATPTGYSCISKPATFSTYPTAPIAEAGKGFVSNVSSQKLFDFSVPPPLLNKAFVSPNLGKLTKTQDFINTEDYSTLHPKPHQYPNPNMNLNDNNPVMETKHILNHRRCEELDRSKDLTSETGRNCNVYSNEGWKNDQRVSETWQTDRGRRQYKYQEDIRSRDTRSNYNRTGRRNKDLRDYLDQCPNPQWDRNYTQGSQYGLKNHSSKRSGEGRKYPSRYSYSLDPRSMIKRARYSDH